MNPTGAQEVPIKRRFRQQTIRAVIFIGVFWLTMLVYMAGADEATRTWFGLSVVFWGPLVAVGSLTGMVGFALSLRCPNCQKSYGRPFMTKFCGNCGVALR